ncbi:hypothetical protein ACSBR2_009763 [Camellia fascicularis]
MFLSESEMDLNRIERHLLKEMGFICHVEHPYKFISNYLAALETSLELRQETWNLANDRAFAAVWARCRDLSFAWIGQDILGIALIITVLQIVHVPNLKSMAAIRIQLFSLFLQKLQNLAGQHSDVLETLLPKIQKQVDVLKELQSQHDKLKAKFFEERAAFEAKY